MSTFHERFNQLYDEARDRDFRTTRAQFAEQLGLSVGRSNAYIDENGSPNFETLKLIAKNAGVSVSWLVGETDERTFAPRDARELPAEARPYYEMFLKLLESKFGAEAQSGRKIDPVTGGSAADARAIKEENGERTEKIAAILRNQTPKFEASPLAAVIFAGLYASKAKGREEQRVKFKQKLLRIVLQKRWPRAKILRLFYSIDYMIRLDDEKKIWMILSDIERRVNEDSAGMKFTFEEMNDTQVMKSKAIVKGKTVARREIARNLFKEGVSIELISKATSLPKEKIAEFSKLKIETRIDPPSKC